MKTAIVHDFMFEYAGSERVVEQMLACFPDADLFVLFDTLPPDQRGFLCGREPRTTFVQNFPWLRWNSARYLPITVPIFPLAIEQIDLSGYDLILSSSHSFAKGVITGPNQCHISYIHSPMRYAWDHQPLYLKAAGINRGIKGWLARAAFSYLRMWDTRTANGVDCYIANSHFIARRIWKTYRRNAEVIYPPVDVQRFPFEETKEEPYLIVSRLAPYKQIGLILEAFWQMPDKKLIVVGDGPERKRLMQAAGPNVKFVGFQEEASLIDYMCRARALIIAAEEDFGITPVEAQACGTPVIAYSRGGVCETVRGIETDTPTGVFFNQQEAAAIVEAVDVFERLPVKISPEACRKNAQRFSSEIFRKKYLAYVGETWDNFVKGQLTNNTSSSCQENPDAIR
jgi:glycosyltransferase involved in cell wall biosynthesis